MRNQSMQLFVKAAALILLLGSVPLVMAQGDTKPTLILTATPDARATYNTPIPNETFTYTLTGFLNGDTEAKACKGAVKLSTPARQGSPVGIYTVNVGGDLSCAKYKIAINTGELHIFPAKLSIVPVSVENLPAGSQLQQYKYNCYFESKLVGTNNCGDYLITGAPTFVTTATTHATTKPGVVVYTSPAGTYEFHATWGSLKSVGGNYTFDFPKGATLTIVPAASK